MPNAPSLTLPNLNRSGRFEISYPANKTQNSAVQAYPAAVRSPYSKTQSLYQEVHSSQFKSIMSPKSSSSLLSQTQISENTARKSSDLRKQACFRHFSILGRRPTNEDAELVFTSPHGFTLVGVFDGHGGSRISYLCAQELPRLFSAVYGEYPTNEIFRHCIDSIESLAFANSQYDEQGCTLCCAYFDKEKLVLCNVGDSRAIVGMKDGKIRQTRDHSPEDQLEVERLAKIPGVFISNEFGVKRVQGSLCLSRAVGDKFMKPYGVISTPDLTEIPKDQAEWLLIACDGLFDVLNSEEIALIIREILKGSNEGEIHDEQELVKCAILYFQSRIQEGDEVIEELTGSPAIESEGCCFVDKEAAIETKMCEMLCRLAYQLGSTDNISVAFGFL